LVTSWSHLAVSGVGLRFVGKIEKKDACKGGRREEGTTEGFQGVIKRENSLIERKKKDLSGGDTRIAAGDK